MEILTKESQVRAKTAPTAPTAVSRTFTPFASPTQIQTESRGRIGILTFGCHHFLHYTLARNQYINNSPGFFSCIRAGTNAGPACIRTEIISPKNLADIWKRAPRNFSCIRAKN